MGRVVDTAGTIDDRLAENDVSGSIDDVVDVTVTVAAVVIGIKVIEFAKDCDITEPAADGWKISGGLCFAGITAEGRFLEDVNGLYRFGTDAAHRRRGHLLTPEKSLPDWTPSLGGVCGDSSGT